MTEGEILQPHIIIGGGGVITEERSGVGEKSSEPQTCGLLP